MEINEIELNGQSLTFEDSVARERVEKLSIDKQDKLIEGVNFKTINEQSLLGSGNITVEFSPKITIVASENFTAQGKAYARGVNVIESTTVPKLLVAINRRVPISTIRTQGRVSLLKNGDYYFYNADVVTINSFEWDTSAVTTFNNAFTGCGQLKSLDVSAWDVSNVTTMSFMFRGCSSLVSLDVSAWDTGRLKDMAHMFNGCGFNKLDARRWNTSNVTNMDTAISHCANLTYVDVSDWNTSNVTNMANLFGECGKLINIKVGRGFFLAKTTVTILAPNWANEAEIRAMVNCLPSEAIEGSPKQLRLSNNTKAKINSLGLMQAITDKGWTIL